MPDSIDPTRDAIESPSRGAMPTRSRIRLAFLVTRMHQGGAERQMLMLARELRRSHDVVFLTMRAGGRRRTG